jgi:hypothetical protein
MSNPSRESLLAGAFREIPQEIAGIKLRRMSAGSFQALGEIANALVAGIPEGEDSKTAIFRAVAEYVWLHSADLKQVTLVEKREDLPAAEIKALAFQIDFAEALEFLEVYKQASLRFAAAMADTDEDENAAALGKSVSARTGSRRSASRSEPPETRKESVTSSGKCPSNEPAPTSTRPTSPTVQRVDGSTMILDHSEAQAQPELPNSSSDTVSSADTE